MLRERGVWAVSVGSKHKCWTHGDCSGPTCRASRTHTGSPFREPLSPSKHPVWSRRSPWSSAHKELCPLIRGPLTSPRTPALSHRCPEQRRRQTHGLWPSAWPGGCSSRLRHLPQTCSFGAQHPKGSAGRRLAHPGSQAPKTTCVSAKTDTLVMLSRILETC